MPPSIRSSESSAWAPTVPRRWRRSAPSRLDQAPVADPQTLPPEKPPSALVPSSLALSEESGATVLRLRGRIDFGVDYSLGDDLVLGLGSFYSGLGRKDLETYGAGLDLRLKF